MERVLLVPMVKSQTLTGQTVKLAHLLILVWGASAFIVVWVQRKMKIGQNVCNVTRIKSAPLAKDVRYAHQEGYLKITTLNARNAIQENIRSI